jgi:hypothetical protein
MLFRRTKSTCAARKVKATASKAKEASTRGLRCCGDEVKVVPSLISAGRRYEQEAAVKMRVVIARCALQIFGRAQRGGEGTEVGRQGGSVAVVRDVCYRNACRYLGF